MVGSMPKPMRAKPVSAAQVRAYATKAAEYAAAATSELESNKAVERSRRCVAIAQAVAASTK